MKRFIQFVPSTWTGAFPPQCAYGQHAGDGWKVVVASDDEKISGYKEACRDCAAKWLTGEIDDPFYVVEAVETI